jgi:hypothetical protein
VRRNAQKCTEMRRNAQKCVQGPIFRCPRGMLMNLTMPASDKKTESKAIREFKQKDRMNEVMAGYSNTPLTP